MLMAALWLYFCRTRTSPRANQVATGLALTIFVTGLSAFIGSGVLVKRFLRIPTFAVPFLSDIPISWVATIVLAYDILVYLIICMTFCAHFFVVNKLVIALVLKAVAKPTLATPCGIKVLRVRYLPSCLAALWRGYQAAVICLLFYIPQVVEKYDRRRGWIALA